MLARKLFSEQIEAGTKENGHSLNYPAGLFDNHSCWDLHLLLPK
jgi:hypothetical protein